MKAPHPRHHIPHFALALAVIAASAAPLAARTLYVTPAGAGLKDGSSWANALAGYGAVSQNLAAGDEFCFAVGDYAVTDEIAVTKNMTRAFRGGYAGTDDSAPFAKAATGATVLAISVGRAVRHLSGTGATIALEDLTFSGGALVATKKWTKTYGGSVSLSACNTTIDNCVFTGNQISVGIAYYYYGGVLSVSSGTLTVRNSIFRDNSLTTTADNVWFYGGAIYSSGATLSISGTTFDKNTLSDKIKPCQGGAVYITGGNSVIDTCVFTTNILYGAHGGNDHTGAAIHATGVTGLTVRDSYFAGNVSKCNTQKSGGLVRLSGATEATTMRLERCVFKANGPTDDNLGMCASIGLNAGILEMEHCLFAELSLPRSGSFKRAIDIQKGTLRASKCTFVNNAAAGIFCHAEQGHVVLTDSIVYGNTQGDLVNFNPDGSNFDVSYCCLGTDYGYGWTGIVTDAPLLSDDGFYHPLSAAGRLADGYFAGSSWTIDTASSPTLDAGNPAADWFDEPQPNNLRMNLGYDADTPAASKSATGAYAHFDSLAVVVLAATNVTDSSAWARGIVGGLGNGGDASVTLVWDTADRGTGTPAAWAHAVPLGTFGQWGHIASQITGLTGGMTCHYRLVASNASGTAWSDDASCAIPVAPTLALSGITHLSRHSARLCATLVDDGAADCETVVTYWKEATPSATFSVTLDARQLPEGVLTRIPLGGLTAGTRYGFRVEVSNPAGTATQTGAFTTLATDAPIARYVTPEGAGIQDGSSWENAYAGLLPALDECLYAGDTIYMKHGTYDHFRIYSSGEMSQIILSNLAGLSIYGGYEGVGAPGGLSDEPTVIARNASNNKRHLNAANSRLHFQNITFSDGCWRTGSVGGGSLYLSGCTTAMTNCVFAGNKVNYTAGGGNSIADGGAIYASGGSLDLYGCVFTNNANFISSECRTHGGAISAASCGLAAKKCLFVGNYAYDTQGHVSGGALYIHGASRADVKECEFISNRCIGTGTTRVLSLGGALAVRNVRSFTMSDSRFTGNFAASTTGRGGSAFFDGNATMTSVVTRCVFDLNGTNLVAGVTDKPELGSVHLDSASLFMTNCLFARTAKTAAITSENVTTFKDINNGAGYSAARKLELVNVTIADSAGAGIAIVGDADVRVRNAVVWGNAGGGLPTDLSEVAYTCSQEAQNGVGNFFADPLLAPAPYYHLVSRGKYIADGWFGGTFAGPRSRASSPCIDAGDPAFDFAAEPKSRGDAINLGAYGGTPWASTTWFPPGTFISIR